MLLPLQKLQVVDATQNVAGPYAAMILADLGANVTKIEPPQGDATRSWGPPFWNGISSSYLALNRNKSSIRLDLKSNNGRKALHRLLSKADVFLESARLGSMKRLGLDYASLKKKYPKLIYVELTAFGVKGPRAAEAGYDPLMQAMGGIMSVTGKPGEAPVRVGVSIIDMATGMWSAIGVLGALRLRESDGQGHKVDTALYETAIAWMCVHFASFWGTGEVPHGWGSGIPMIAPYEAFQASDGWIVIGAGNDKLFQNLCQVLGHPEWAYKESKFSSNAKRVHNRHKLHDLIEKIVRTQSATHWEKRLKEMDIPVASLQSIDRISKEPQLKAAGIVQRIRHPTIRDFRSVGLPLRIDGRRPPLLKPPPE